jgi:hypothetical protein
MKETQNKNKKSQDSAKNFVAGQIGTLASSNYANATDAALGGMDVFWKVFEREGNNPQKYGNLFECIEAMKFNIDAALKRSDLKAEVTALTNRTAKADILITKAGKIVREVQAKCCKSSNYIADEMINPDYYNMQRLVPKDKEAGVTNVLKEWADDNPLNDPEYKDALENLSGKTRHENVSSPGTSYDESICAKEHSKLYSAKIQAKQAASEAAVAGASAAATGFVITGGISAVKNLIAVQKDEKTLKKAASDALKAGIGGGVKSGVIGAGGAVIRFGAKKAGIEAFEKASPATAIAAGILDTGDTLYSFVKGDIGIEEAMERLGQNGVSTVYGLFAGAVTSAVFSGPVVAVAATTAGYLIANFAYQSCIAIFRQAKLTEKESERIIAIYEEAIQQMQIRRAEFEKWFEEELQGRREDFSACFDAIDNALINDDPGKAVFALADFATLFGKKLNFETFDEFDDFMGSSDEPLML